MELLTFVKRIFDSQAQTVSGGNVYRLGGSG